MATKTYSDGRVVKYNSKSQKVMGGNTVSRSSVPNPPNVKQSVRETSIAPVAPETKPVGQTPVAPVVPATEKAAPVAPVAPVSGGIDSVEKAKAAGAFDAINGGGAYAKSLGDRMKEGLSAVKNGGTEAPNSQGQAGLAISQVTPPAEYQPPTDIQTEVDDTLSVYSQAIAEYLNPKNQRSTLMQDYKAISKSLGIQDLQEDLIDINRIMDGTEDDIRSEVTAAAGFATDSQVQAMTIGRNKSLLKKAQYISDQLVAAKDQLATLSQLNAQDKQFADQRMQTGIQLLGNMVQIKQSMQRAAQDNYRWYADKAGLDSLYASTGGDPFNVGMVEKTLGMPPGGLQKAAVQAQQQKARDAEKEALQLDVLKSNLQTDVLQRDAIRSNIETDKAQRANIYSQISSRNNPSSKPPTQAQLQIAGYTDRLKQSNAVISKLENKFTGVGSYLGKIVPTIFKSSERQQMEQAERNFINSVLRRESGAAISEGEFENARKQYFPQPGNDKAVLQQKAANRATVINSFTRESGNVPTSNIIIAPDGTEIELTD